MMAAWSVFLQNFTTKYGGRIAVVIALGTSGAASFVSFIDLDFSPCEFTQMTLFLMHIVESRKSPPTGPAQLSMPPSPDQSPRVSRLARKPQVPN